jgi:ribosomal protein L11 methyltransferase
VADPPQSRRDDQPRWLQVSLVVDGEMAEAVAEVLGRFVTNGVVVESGVIFNDAEDEGTPSGPLRVYGYLSVDEHLEETRRRLEEALWHLGQIQPLPPASFQFVADENWMAAWKVHYHPIPVGERLLVLPAWLESEYPDRIAVRIDPSMAFGTGTHPSTQICMELLECYTPIGQPVIDVGCGSGILSIAAVKLGASRALAVDIDAQAVRSTCENAEANGVLAQIESGQGSVADILAGHFSIRQAPLVLANILAPVIIRLFTPEVLPGFTAGPSGAGLADLVAPGGWLVLSGILDHQADEVVQTAVSYGMTEVERRQITDWVAIALKKTISC